MGKDNKGGRPPKEFDRQVFEGLCGIMCTEQEICNVLNTTDKTLDNWCKRTYDERFSEVYKKMTDRGKMSLRRNQFQLSKKNAAMAIFLGKQYLGQRDNVEYEDKEALARLDAILNGLYDKAKRETE